MKRKSENADLSQALKQSQWQVFFLMKMAMALS